MLGCFSVHLDNHNVTCVGAPLFSNIEIEVEGTSEKTSREILLSLCSSTRKAAQRFKRKVLRTDSGAGSAWLPFISWGRRELAWNGPILKVAGFLYPVQRLVIVFAPALWGKVADSAVSPTQRGRKACKLRNGAGGIVVSTPVRK